MQIGKEENKLTMDILLDYEKNRPVAEKLVVTQREGGWNESNIFCAIGNCLVSNRSEDILLEGMLSNFTPTFLSSELINVTLFLFSVLFQ